MPFQLNDRLLHKETHHSNIDIPIDSHIGYDKFPGQNKNLLGSTINIKYRDRYEVDRNTDEVGKEENFEDNINYETNIWNQEFKIIRCDISEPYRMICISKNYKKLIVTDSRNYDNIISVYPDQLVDFLGMEVIDQYIADTREYNGVVIGCDNGEPCNSVIVESLIDSHEIRIVLEDECQSKMSKIIRINNINCYFTEDKIALLRKTLLEGKKIYGTS